MHPFYHEFAGLLDNEDKEGCVRSVLSLLAESKAGIVELYNQVLTPAVNTPPSGPDRQTVIWLEHVRTSIVRTIIECCYPRVLEEKEATFGPGYRGKVIIACPSDEYHDLGARMVCDFFTLCGYDVIFIGANTPENEIATAVRHIEPACIGISVSNYYHLVAAGRLVKLLERMRSEPGYDFKIIMGGSAFERNPDLYRQMGADLLLQTYEDIKQFCDRTGDAPA